MKKTSLLVIILVASTACAGSNEAPLPTLAATFEPPRAISTVIPPTPVPQNTNAPTAVAALQTASPTQKAESKILTQGITPDGFFTLGDPNAKVTVIDYSDFL